MAAAWEVGYCIQTDKYVQQREPGGQKRRGLRLSAPRAAPGRGGRRAFRRATPGGAPRSPETAAIALNKLTSLHVDVDGNISKLASPQEDGARLGNYPMYYYLTRFLGRQPKKGVVLS